MAQISVHMNVHKLSPQSGEYQLNWSYQLQVKRLYNTSIVTVLTVTITKT